MLRVHLHQTPDHLPLVFQMQLRSGHPSSDNLSTDTRWSMLYDHRQTIRRDRVVADVLEYDDSHALLRGCLSTEEPMIEQTVASIENELSEEE